MNLLNLDYIIFQLINNLAGNWPVLDWLGVFLAGYLQYVVGLGLLIYWFWGKNREERVKNLYQAGVALAAVALSRLVLTEIIRWIWWRPRPFIDHAVNLLIEHENAGSLPSGHAAFFFALASAVYFLSKKIYPEPFDFAQGKLYRGVSFWLFAAAILISLARVYVGVHYPLDILAGAIVGIFSGWLVVWLYKLYQNKKAR